MNSNIKTILLYPPEQSWPETVCKPNGSLAYPMLAGALTEAGFDVNIFDACVGNDEDDLNEVFYKRTALKSGMLRTGVSDERILKIVADADIVGITSIFSHQETMALRTATLIKKQFPKKLIISGGANARHRIKQFMASGIDIVCMSEAEETVVEIARTVSMNKTNFDHISQIAINNKSTVTVKNSNLLIDLDKLPMPRWDLLPNNRYWQIGRPHGGYFVPGTKLKYASMMTSLGCPFNCTFCHISKEKNDIGKFRIKSDERVLTELQTLTNMGVKQVFIEDDSIFGHKKRAIRLINKIKMFNLDILDVNGVNIIHLVKAASNTTTLVPDHDVLSALALVGFKEICLPFESGNQRIIKKYASNKWDINRVNVSELIKACNQYGIRIAGNFMIGFPDETREEVEQTLNFAKKCMYDGLNAANFFLVLPLPGTNLFDQAVLNNNLSADYEPDKMHWQKANLINTIIPAQELELIRDRAWKEINNVEHTEYKKSFLNE